MFLFVLAAHLGMTVKRLCQEMDSDELSEWIAINRYFFKIPDMNSSMALLTSAVLAPHCKRGQAPKPARFEGLDVPPKHPIQDQLSLQELAADMAGFE